MSEENDSRRSTEWLGDYEGLVSRLMAEELVSLEGARKLANKLGSISEELRKPLSCYHQEGVYDKDFEIEGWTIERIMKREEGIFGVSSVYAAFLLLDGLIRDPVETKHSLEMEWCGKGVQMARRNKKPN